MSDLFPETVETELKPKPRSLDLRTEHLKERYNLHPEWVWYSFEAIGDWPTKFAKYSGGVYRHAIRRGKYKGQTDYKRPELGTEASVVLDDDAFEAWLPIWEARTGKCSTCLGSGQKWIGWNNKEGNRYVDCPRCGTTGIAPAIADRNGNRRDRATGLGPKDESGGAVGNRPTNSGAYSGSVKL